MLLSDNKLKKFSTKRTLYVDKFSRGFANEDFKNHWAN